MNIPLPKNTVIRRKAMLIPHHVAIVPDGNRRWARARDLHTFEGHKKGFDNAVRLARAAREWGIHTVTLWGFSTENWDRDEREVSYLMKLYEKLVDDYLKEAKRDNVKIVHLGRKDRIPRSLLKKIQYAEDQTSKNTKYIMNIAIDYGGHDEIMRAIRAIVKDGIDASKVDKKMVEKYLDTHGQPYPYVDLFIRTSAEQRTSGLLPWQAEYAEIYWSEDHFPDFGPEKLAEAVSEYSRRRRRFGGNDDVRKFAFKPHVVARFELLWWRARRFHNKQEFAEAFVNYAKEQFGLSVTLATDATKLFVRAALLGDEGDWGKARKTMTGFYRLLKRNIKLAFEPSIVADLSVEYLQKTNGEKRIVESHEVVQRLFAELFRIPLLQAEKIADLRLLAQDQEAKAEETSGKKEKQVFLRQAEKYLTRSYEVLKERVA